MRKTILAALGSALLAACGGDCEPRTGTYLLRATWRSGNCGAGGETFVTAGGAATPGCATQTSASDDNCKVTATTTCDNGERHAGTVTWARDGNSGTGVLEISDATCQGTYAVSYSRP